MNNDDRKRKIVELYLRVKKMTVFGEEICRDYKSYLQPSFEINRAFDHLCKASAAELGIRTVDDAAEFIEDNLRKAEGHLYRAFFDAADFVAINLRENIAKEYENFSHLCIQSMAPEYYLTIKPEIDRVSREIANLRNDKDVSTENTEGIIDRYETLLLGLEKEFAGVIAKKGAIIDCEERGKTAIKADRRWQIKFGICCILWGALLGTILGRVLQ